MSVRTPAWPVYDVFETSDGGQVFVGVVTDTAWPAFCVAFGLDGLAADASLATKQQRVAERGRTIPVIAAALRHYSKADLMEKCEALGLPFAPIGKPADLFDDPHLNASGGLVPMLVGTGWAVVWPHTLHLWLLESLAWLTLLITLMPWPQPQISFQALAELPPKFILLGSLTGRFSGSRPAARMLGAR